MQFNKIEEVRVGNNKNGIIESDGNIFAILSANYDQNYDKAPSKFSLSVAGVDSSLEMKEYLGFDSNGSTIYDGKQGLTFSIRNLETINIVDSFTFTGFLIAYSESISAGERTYQLQYVDRSIILDKIFVGLTNRHAEVTNPVGGTVEVTALCGTSSEQVSKRFGFGTKTGIGPKLNTARVWDEDFRKSYIPYRAYNRKEYFSGGAIIVGDEQFSENFCSIPAVSYTFKDLIDGMADAGITVKSSTGNFKAFAKGGLRREYSGTLRTVLTSWCADYGLFYLWEEGKDVSKNASVISFYDMRSGVGNIKGMKKTLLNLGVEDLEFSQSKENTKFSALVTRFIKPPSINEQTINMSTRVHCSPITLNDVASVSQIKRPRGANSFLMSCMLAKASPDLRTLWYISDGEASNSNFKWEGLGIYIVTDAHAKFGKGLTLGGRARNNLLRGTYTEEYKEIHSEFNATGGETPSVSGINVSNMDVYLVYKSDDMESRFLDWEKSIADDFVGQYWRTAWTSRHPDTSDCASLYGRRLKVADSNPPFINSRDVVIPKITMDPYGGATTASPSFKSGEFHMNRVVKRDSAPWGTSLPLDKEDNVKSLTPRFVPVTAEHYDVLFEAGILTGDVDQSFAMGGAEFQLGFLFVRRDIGEYVSFIGGTNFTNPLEATDAEVNGGDQDSSDGIEDCKPSCSVDIAEFICGGTPQNGSNLQPAVADETCFGISVSGKLEVVGNIFAPVGAKGGIFYRIETINFQNFLSRKGIKNFEDSQVLGGSGGTAALAAASVDIVEEDMSNGIVYTSSTGGANTLINGSSWIVNDGIGQSMGSVTQQSNQALEDHYRGISQSMPIGTEQGSQSLTASLPGSSFKLIRDFISIDQGLSSLSFSFGSEGSTTNVTFRSVPIQRIDRELTLPMIKTLTSHFRN